MASVQALIDAFRLPAQAQSYRVRHLMASLVVF